VPASHLLFHRKTLNNALSLFAFPGDLADKQQRLFPWIETLQRGTLDEIKEVSLQGEFLATIFQQILGYRSPITGRGKTWELCAEQNISDGGSADGALGLFSGTHNEKGKIKLSGRVVAPIELKGAKNNLDRPTSGRKESAVDQGWRYANYSPNCQWIVVSNYRELRLYCTSRTPSFYEAFFLEELADIEVFKRFYYLLCRENFLPPAKKPKSPSRIDRLLAESNEAEESITEQLYREYAELRVDLARHFWFSGPQDIDDRDTILVEKAQKALDRILFVAFCEDKKLLPDKTLQNAHDIQDPYYPRPIWENYKAVFRWVDRGNDDPPIPGYNGGLFQFDPILDDRLSVPDVLCSRMKQLTRFDFDTEVSVNILGHIFEQSVTDLEALRSQAKGEEYDRATGQRKTQGVFYTPAFITQYIVKAALGTYLDRREEELRDRFGNLDDRSTEIAFWQAYRDEVLLQTRVLDPACGSGAFLIAAFSYLSRQYDRVAQALSALEFEEENGLDRDETILTRNLYGVDLSPESAEITKLSLWLQTARPGKPLTDLDDRIKVGNSIVADAGFDGKAFDWEAAFPEVFASGGFDVVIGNPPYVRQELLSSIKLYLQTHYESYNGVADLYTYFYERGVKLLKPDGILSYIVTNKWLRSGYGEALRNFFANRTVVEQLIDFGHAPIFPDADTFPCILVVRKLEESQPETESRVLVCPVPREKLPEINLPQYVDEEGYDVPRSRFSQQAWSLERPEVDELMQKIRAVGVPLKEFTGVKPYRGILTGFNQAFLIDDGTKNKIVQADPKSAEIIKPYLRGQDIKRWHSEWQNLWLLFISWECPINQYPSILAWLEQDKSGLQKRPEVKKGRFPWYALSRYGAEYSHLFDNPKIIYQEINTFPSYSLDLDRYFLNNKVFFLPASDLYVLGLLNSPIGWWIAHQIFPKMIGDAVTPRGNLIVDFPIAPPTNATRSETEELTQHLIDLTRNNQDSHRDILDWLRLEHSIEKTGRKLENFSSLDLDEFIKEIRKRKPKGASFSPQAVRQAKEAYNDYTPKIRDRNAEIQQLERRLSELVNQAYQLTPEEVELMWQTAPPRMPVDRPSGSRSQ